MASGERARRREGGFTYLGVLVAVVLLGLALSAAGEVVSTAARREREAQLLWVGHEYRAAIGRYVGQRRSYPRTLEELLGSAPDAPVQVRYLRRLYPDPMTGAVDWVLVPAPGGGIMGVASSSKHAPLKAGGFDDADKAFADASAYADWQFTYSPVVIRPPTPASPAVRPEKPPVGERGRANPAAGPGVRPRPHGLGR